MGIVVLLVLLLLLLLCSCNHAFVDLKTGIFRFSPSESLKTLEENAQLLLANPPGPQTITDNVKQAQVVVTTFAQQLIDGAAVRIPDVHLDLVLGDNPVFELIQREPWLMAPVAQIGLLVVFAVLGTAGSNSVGDGGTVYSTGRYNAKEAEQYFSKKPLLVAGRGVAIASKSFGFALSLLSDFFLNKLSDPAQVRFCFS